MERWRRGGSNSSSSKCCEWSSLKLMRTFFFFLGFGGKTSCYLFFCFLFIWKKKKTLDFVSFLFFGLSSLFNSAISNHFSSNKKKKNGLLTFSEPLSLSGKKKQLLNFPTKNGSKKKPKRVLSFLNSEIWSLLDAFMFNLSLLLTLNHFHTVKITG